MANTNKELIEKMYGSSMESAKQQLQQDYDANVSALDQQKAENEKATQIKLGRTAVEADKARKNYLEVQNAYGLSSGAMAQARLAQDNQLRSDMATIRAAQQTADQGIEAEKNLLARQFQAAISKAQADNDLEKAKALYSLAREEESKLLEKQKTAAASMASVGDYTLHGQLYGLSPEQIAALNAQYQKEQTEATRKEELAKQEAAAGLMAAAGDFSLYGQLYGLTPQQIAALEAAYRAENSSSSGSSSGSSSASSETYTQNTGSLTDAQIKELQKAIGTTADGIWGNQSAAAAANAYGVSNINDAWQAYQNSGSSGLSGLRKQYPSGVISNPIVWSELAAQYTEAELKKAGFTFKPAAANARW